MLKRNPVVIIGVRRRSVGRDNRSRWRTEVGDSPNFALTEFSEVRFDGVLGSSRREEAIWAGVGQFDSSDWTICESVKSTI